MNKRLHRSEAKRMLFGVCGGVAEYLDVDATLVRIAFVVLTLATGGIGALLYIALAFIMPSEASLEKLPSDVLKENSQEMASTVRELGEDIRTSFASRGAAGPRGEATRVAEDPVEVAERAERRRNLAGLVLIVVGALFLLSNLRLLWWINWSIMWPIALIAIGVFVLTARRS